MPAVDCMDFTGKVAVVMGAGPGLGGVLAGRFAGAGAEVCVVARSERSVQGAAAAARTAGRDPLALTGDVVSLEQVRSLSEQVMDRFGRVDVLVNMAFGAMPRRHVIDYTDEDLERWRQTVEVGGYGTLLACRFFAPHMVRQRSGAIVNLTSLSSRLGMPGRTEYASGKAQAHKIANSLAKELGPHGVRVNSVAPGSIWSEVLENFYRELAVQHGRTYEEELAHHTGNMALRRIATNEEVANAVLFLASDLASGITGALIDVNAGEQGAL